jgi:hypothetical protein
MIPGSAASILLASAGSDLVIGQAFEGGYYAGTATYSITQYDDWLRNTEGPSYHLVVAPKASGEASTIKQYKTSATCDGAESTQTSAQSRWDGYHNTYTSVIGSSNAHPAANYCQALTIGGYSDWYLPGLFEANLAFGNLLDLPAWQVGGSEEFKISGASWYDGGSYWSSTGDSCENTGSQGSASFYFIPNQLAVAGLIKTESLWVRAIRRVAV